MLFSLFYAAHLTSDVAYYITDSIFNSCDSLICLVMTWMNMTLLAIGFSCNLMPIICTGVHCYHASVKYIQHTASDIWNWYWYKNLFCTLWCTNCYLLAHHDLVHTDIFGTTVWCTMTWCTQWLPLVHIYTWCTMIWYTDWTGSVLLVHCLVLGAQWIGTYCNCFWCAVWCSVHTITELPEVLSHCPCSNNTGMLQPSTTPPPPTYPPGFTSLFRVRTGDKAGPGLLQTQKTMTLLMTSWWCQQPEVPTSQRQQLNLNSMRRTLLVGFYSHVLHLSRNCDSKNGMLTRVETYVVSHLVSQNRWGVTLQKEIAWSFKKNCLNLLSLFLLLDLAF